MQRCAAVVILLQFFNLMQFLCLLLLQCWTCVLGHPPQVKFIWDPRSPPKCEIIVAMVASYDGDPCHLPPDIPTLQAKALLQLMSVKRPPSSEILGSFGEFFVPKMFFHKGCLLPCVVFASEHPWSPHRNATCWG